MVYGRALTSEDLKKGVGTAKILFIMNLKRDLKRRLIYEYRCDERLKTKNEESTRLVDTEFFFCLL